MKSFSWERYFIHLKIISFHSFKNDFARHLTNIRVVTAGRVADYVYNQAGNPEGHYRVGVFDEEGKPLPKGFERT